MGGIQKSGIRYAALILLVSAALAVTSSGQSNAPGQRFSAVGIDMDRGTTTQLQIVVERWSSQAQSERLQKTLVERGPEKLLDALQDAPKVGYIRTTTSLAWDLRYAERKPGEDGGERVTLITDRPIAFWETANQTRTLDYPFTVIEMRLNADGEGKGMLSVATKIVADKNGQVTLENWGTQPIQLTQVKAEKLTE